MKALEFFEMLIEFPTDLIKVYFDVMGVFFDFYVKYLPISLTLTITGIVLPIAWAIEKKMKTPKQLKFRF